MKNSEYKNILPRRQVHLDFHTSPPIDGIGENFDGETFADTLKKQMWKASPYSPNVITDTATIPQRLVQCIRDLNSTLPEQ